MPGRDLESQLLAAYDEVGTAFGIPPGVICRDYVRHLHTLNLVARFAPRSTHPRVLDVSAGWAVPSRCLQRNGYDVHLTDSPMIAGEEVCAFNERLFPLTHINDLERDALPFEPGSFDVVLWLATIEHLQNSPRRVLEWIRSILKPGGVVIIDTPNVLELRKRLMLLLGWSIMPSMKFLYDGARHSDHHFEYTQQDLEYVLGRAGFEVVSSECVDTLSGLSIQQRIRHGKRKATESQIGQMTQFAPGFNPRSLYSYAQLPMRLLLKVRPALRDTLYIVGRV